MILRLTPTALLLLPLLGALARAQEVAGTVREDARQAPLAGAVVVLISPSGARLGATLTDSAGRFRLRAPAPGTFTLRVDVIGYRSAVVPSIAIESGATVTRDILFRFQRTQLPAIAVTAASACASVSNDAGDAPALWAEARKTLEATQLAIDERRFNVALRRFERTIGLPDSVLRDSRTWTQTGVSRNPFETLPPETIARDGFAVMRDTSRYFYAPDATVLLSDTFVAGHCFGTRRGGPGGALGLTFRPQRNTRQVDISGVLWLDSASAELRTLEYRYVTSGRLQEGGGLVAFGRYPSGVWGVHRWAIRLPVLHVTESRRRPDGASGRFVDTLMVAIHEVGGEVVAAGASPTTSSTATRLRGLVFDSTQGAPLSNAIVTIEGLGRTTTTDSAGRFAFDSLADEGEVRVRAWHPRLDSLGFSAPVTPVRLRRRTETHASFDIPGIAEVSRVRCASASRGTARVIMGVVRSGPDTAPPAAVTEVVLLERRGGAEGTRDSLVRHVAITSDAGRYAFCEAMPGAQAWLLVRHGQDWSNPRYVVADRSMPVEMVPLQVPVIPDSIRAESPSTGAPLIVLGRTLDPARASRISGWALLPEDFAEPVQVLVDDVVRTTTAADGSFALDAVGAGTRRLTFRGRSIAVRHVALDVQAGQSQLLLVSLRPAPVVVVQPKPARRDPTMEGFVRRRAAGGGGYFIERPEIERRNPRTLTDLLRGIPGVRVIAKGTGFRYVTTHFSRLPNTADDGLCDMLVFLDGQIFPIEAASADAQISVAEIRAMEVYVSAATVPRLFAGVAAACGVIVIWRG